MIFLDLPHTIFQWLNQKEVVGYLAILIFVEGEDPPLNKNEQKIIL